MVNKLKSIHKTLRPWLLFMGCFYYGMFGGFTGVQAVENHTSGFLNLVANIPTALSSMIRSVIHVITRFNNEYGLGYLFSLMIEAFQSYMSGSMPFSELLYSLVLFPLTVCLFLILFYIIIAPLITAYRPSILMILLGILCGCIYALYGEQLGFAFFIILLILFGGVFAVSIIRGTEVIGYIGDLFIWRIK